VNPVPASKPPDPGFRALVWIASLAAVLIVVWLAANALLPAPSALGSWMYPGTQTILTTNLVSVTQHDLHSTTDDFDTVARWYDKKLRMGSGDPAFMAGRTPFSGQHRQMKISLPKSGGPRPELVEGARGTWYCELTDRGVRAASISKAPAESVTRLSLVQMDTSFVRPRGRPAKPGLAALAYPSAKAGSGGTAAGLEAFQYTSADTPTQILAHYLEKFGAAAGTTLAPGTTLTIGGAPNGNQIVRLADLERAGVEQASLLLFTPTNVCLLDLVRPTNGTVTQMILGVLTP